MGEAVEGLSPRKVEARRFFVTLIYESKPSERRWNLDPEEAMAEAFGAFERLLKGTDPDLAAVTIGIEGRL